MSTQINDSKLEELQAMYGEVEGRDKYLEIQAEAKADVILSSSKYVYEDSIKNYKKEMNSLADKGLLFSNEYRDKKVEIESNKDLTQEGKAKRISELYQKYNAEVQSIIREQQAVSGEHYKNRHKVANETLEVIKNRCKY